MGENVKLTSSLLIGALGCSENIALVAIPDATRLVRIRDCLRRLESSWGFLCRNRTISCYVTLAGGRVAVWFVRSHRLVASLRMSELQVVLVRSVVNIRRLVGWACRCPAKAIVH